VRAMVDSTNRSLECAGLTAADIALAVPHQANVRIVDAACHRLGIPVERTANVLDRTGNTSAASIPIALVDAIEAGRVHDGDVVRVDVAADGSSLALTSEGKPAPEIDDIDDDEAIEAILEE